MPEAINPKDGRVVGAALAAEATLLDEDAALWREIEAACIGVEPVDGERLRRALVGRLTGGHRRNDPSPHRQAPAPAGVEPGMAAQLATHFRP